MQRFAQAGVAAAGAVWVREAEVAGGKAEGSTLGEGFSGSSDHRQIIDRRNSHLNLNGCCGGERAVEGGEGEGVEGAGGVSGGFPLQFFAGGEECGTGGNGDPGAAA